MRLIDADALMKDINNSLDAMTDIGIAVDGDWLWEKLNDALDNAPTIEPRKGKWIEPSKEGYVSFDYKTYRECSLCGKKQFLADKMNYCPNCGADMRGE